jgi:crossover junction endodeoxyribonuclease RuvC
MTVPVTAIGIDPGLASTGFAVIELLDRRGRVCQCGTITTQPVHALSARLSSIYTNLSEILLRWHPQLMVVEDVFVLKKYPKAAIQLGAVRGVVLLAAEHSRIRVCEIKPTEVKSALTGNGRASKEHVGNMIRRILNFEGSRTSDHVSDAMALAVTGLSRSGLLRW